MEFISEFARKQPAAQDMDAKRIYLIGEKPFYKWAMMKCPCGCGEVLTMSLMKKHKPNWVVRQDNNNRISLSPSIWKKDGCRSHFFIKKGQLIWISESEERERN